MPDSARKGLCLQAFASAVIWPYYHSAYRIRGWGRLPVPRGATLVILNHQHDLDSTSTVMHLSLGGPLHTPVHATTGRRLFEPGFLGLQVFWAEPLLRRIDASKLFRALGMAPLENQIRSRPVLGFAHAVHDKHGDIPLSDVFRAGSLDALGPDLERRPISFLFSGAVFRRAMKTEVRLKAVNEPYRSEMLAEMRDEVEHDLAGVAALLEHGGTLYLTPEGVYTKTGRLGRFRAALARLAPLAENIYTHGISYDVFVGPRLSQLFHLVPAADRDDLESSLKAARPVTVSQLLADWLVNRMERSNSFDRPVGFTGAEALAAVRARLAALPELAFVDPELQADPAKMVRAALARMRRLGVLVDEGGVMRLTERRTHPHFPNVKDMVAFQAAFFEESQDGWRTLANRHGPV
jgi:1-acyl-sn-glycerol-3-phosphate acyltransferase